MLSHQHNFPCLDKFAPVSLQALNGENLMARIDQKFILPEDKLNQLLCEIVDDYKVLEIQNKRRLNYKSLYYDTDSFKFYFDHHNGKPNRIKVRTREYVDTSATFFEIKKKVKGRRTEKYRFELTGKKELDKKSEAEFLELHKLAQFELLPTVLISYSRITLHHITQNERVTIDTQLSFKKGETEKQLKNLVIIEVKQKVANRISPVMQALRKHRYRPLGMSKYALAMVMLRAVNKSNAFKHKLFKINQLSFLNGIY